MFDADQYHLKARVKKVEGEASANLAPANSLKAELVTLRSESSVKDEIIKASVENISMLETLIKVKDNLITEVSVRSRLQ